MTWMVAHIVSVVEPISGEAERYPVSEELYLINAASEAELDAAIKNISRMIEAAGACTLDGVPARTRVVGARKISSIYNPPPYGIGDVPPVHGSEVGNINYSFNSIAEITKFVSGEEMFVKFVE